MPRGRNPEDDPGLLPEEKFQSMLFTSSTIRPEVNRYNWPVELERLDLYDVKRSRIYEDKLEGKIVWALADFCQCLMPPSYFWSRQSAYCESEQIRERRVRYSPIYLAFIESIAAKKLGETGLEATEIEGDYFLKPVDLLAEAKRLGMLKYMPAKMRTLVESLPLVPRRKGTNRKEPRSGQIQGMKTGAPKHNSKSPVKTMSRVEVVRMLAEGKSTSRSTASKRVARAIESTALKPLQNGSILEAEAILWTHASPPVKPRERESDYG